MSTVYFDTSIFLAIFNGESSGPDIRALLRELRKDGRKISTSIVTVQEVSVLPFRMGVPVVDNHSKVSRMARIQGVSKEIALTAAKIEAQMIDRAIPQAISQRRKLDCFHLATALTLHCTTLYTLDNGMMACDEFVAHSGMRISEPKPLMMPLFKDATVL